MRNSEKLVVAACADAMFPPAGPIPISGTEAGLVEYFDQYLNGLPRIQRLGMSLMFIFIQLSPFIFGPRRTRFTRLLAAERERMLSEMEKSAVYLRRIVIQSLRLILTAGYFAHPAVDALITGKKRKEAFS